MSSKAIDPVLKELFQPEMRKSDLKKLKIVAAAIDCLAHDCPSAATLDAIGKKLKISRSHVGYYFKDKEELFEDVIRYVTASAQTITLARLRLATTAEEQLEAIVKSAFVWAETYPEHARVMIVFYHQCSYDPKYRTINTRIRESGRERLVEVLSRLSHNKGDDKSKEQLIQMARSIQCLVTGTLMEHFSTESKKSLAEVGRETYKLISQLSRFRS